MYFLLFLLMDYAAGGGSNHSQIIITHTIMTYVKLIVPLLVLMASACSPNGEYTRGIGVYPGNPDEYPGPEMTSGKSEYRNLALHKAAFHSSSYDYNLTAHLATDGIRSAGQPYFIDVVTSDGQVAKRDRERIFDDNTTSLNVWQQEGAYLMLSMYNPPKTSARTIAFNGALNCKPDRPSDFEITIEACGSDGLWETLSTFKGHGIPGHLFNDRRQGPVGGGSQNVSLDAGLKISNNKAQTIQTLAYYSKTRGFDYRAEIPEGKEFTSFRINLGSDSVTDWNFQEVNFLDADGNEVSLLPSYFFSSCWMSDSAQNEWLYVDLGAEASFDKVVLDWIAAPESGVLETSNDLKTWKKIGTLTGDEQELAVKGRGRYVRLGSLNGPERLILSEMEVWGKGGTVPVAKEQPEAIGNRLYLSGGEWKLKRSSEVSGTPEQISGPGYDDSGWLVASVPSTVAGSYFNAGAIPDIRYDDDQLQISESFFYSDFWYRDVFTLPDSFSSKDLVLNFDGINWKAEVYFNGSYVGLIEGAFTRAHFDVTSLAVKGDNVLAVKIIKNNHPGIVKEQTRDFTDTNGGVLGADNPTMHATIGWDWIPTVRGRDIGIWNDVFISAYEGGVSIDDVFVDTGLPLPSTDYADLSPIVTLTNHNAEPKKVDIQLTYGELVISGTAELPAGETADIALETKRMDAPVLWWPVGYGEPYLYDVTTVVTVDGSVSDTKEQKSGIRKMTYTTDGGILDMYINGRRLIGNGGNWGYPEIYNNYRAREYDIAVAYHADMNFTMIRNWVGMTGDEEFYEACDRHGVMIWQDFWLANPYDGPDPYYEDLFEANATDHIRKIRNHPSIAIYVGRNEGYPPQSLDNRLQELVDELHPGMFYYPHSAEGLVSGGGPYRALSVSEYFTAERGRDRFHSERGMPNSMTAESMKRMLREENQWPQTSVWGMHDFTLSNAQSAATFNAMIEKAFGEPESLDQFAEYAQWINYNGYRAIFESRSFARKGVQLWMSHSCWPSMVWQTYDYYFEPTAAYFGCKKGSAPIRIQWNPVEKVVEVVNNNALRQEGLTAYAALVNYDGDIVFEQTASLDSDEDTTIPVFGLDIDNPGITDTYYIKLRLNKGDEVIADNFYWEGKEDGNYSQLLLLDKVKPGFTWKLSETDGEWTGTAVVTNDTSTPALMLRLKLTGADGEEILPVFYSDNYFSLLPGESKTVTVKFKDEDTYGRKPNIKLSGFNVK